MIDCVHTKQYGALYYTMVISFFIIIRIRQVQVTRSKNLKKVMIRTKRFVNVLTFIGVSIQCIEYCSHVSTPECDSYLHAKHVLNVTARWEVFASSSIHGYQNKLPENMAAIRLIILCLRTQELTVFSVFHNNFSEQWCYFHIRFFLPLENNTICGQGVIIECWCCKQQVQQAK